MSDERIDEWLNARDWECFGQCPVHLIVRFRIRCRLRKLLHNGPVVVISAIILVFGAVIALAILSSP